jgi:hypothetical protein
MNLATADIWVDALNASNHLGIVTWRLPEANPINGLSYVGSWSEDGSTDRARNLSAAGSVYEGSTASEMARLYFNTLGKISTRDVNGDPTACFGSNCLSNTGHFQIWKMFDTGRAQNRLMLACNYISISMVFRMIFYPTKFQLFGLLLTATY